MFSRLDRCRGSRGRGDPGSRRGRHGNTWLASSHPVAGRHKTPRGHIGATMISALTPFVVAALAGAWLTLAVDAWRRRRLRTLRREYEGLMKELYENDN